MRSPFRKKTDLDQLLEVRAKNQRFLKKYERLRLQVITEHTELQVLADSLAKNISECREAQTLIDQAIQREMEVTK